MMTILKTAMAAACLLALVACASPVSERFYRLDYAPPPAQAGVPQYEVVLEALTLPESVNRAQIVLQKSATEVEILDQQRWIAPLAGQILQALSAQLQNDLPRAWVSTRLDSHGSGARYLVRADIEQLLISPGRQITLEASWRISDAARLPLQRQHRRLTIALDSVDPAAIAPTLSQLLQQWASLLAQDVQQQAGR